MDLGSFGFIPGDFSKASGNPHLPPARRGEKGFFFGVEKGSINSKM